MIERRIIGCTALLAARTQHAPLLLQVRAALECEKAIAIPFLPPSPAQKHLETPLVGYDVSFSASFSSLALRETHDDSVQALIDFLRGLI